MLFSSITFLYVFLPIVVMIYYLAGTKFKNFILFIASILFYTWGQGRYVLLLLGMTLLGYIAALLIEKHQDMKLARSVLAGFILIVLLFLGYYKYFNFIIQNINLIFSGSIAQKNILLPIGISFYSFQLISYVVDVSLKRVSAQRNFLTFGTYVTFFPQLIAGPIVRYKDMEMQLQKRSHSLDGLSSGVNRFIIGLSKKVLVANQMGELCEFYRGTTKVSVLYAWMYAVAFALQIYYDFSGYSDMAIGLGKMFGFDLPENFDYPYMAKSVTEFWRRWHISLGNWFRDYVYIPLGGNRKGISRQLINIIIVWALTGLWHGCAWNFVLWGLFYAILLWVEKMGFLKWLEKHDFIAHCYLTLTVIFGFVIFDGGTVTQIVSVLGQMMGLPKILWITFEALYYFKSYAVLILIAIIGASNFPKKIGKRLPEKVQCIVQPLYLVTLFLIVTAYLIDGSFNPFLYFRF